MMRPQRTEIAGPVTDWLRRLNQAVVATFARRDRVDNLYAWSRVNAASFALLARDPGAMAHQSTVWQRSIAMIGLDGLLPHELERGQRALIYHQLPSQPC